MTGASFWQRLVFITLTSGLALAPIAFGGATGWFTGAFAAFAGTLALSWSATAVTDREQTHAQPPSIMIPFILFGTVIVWCIVQALLPVPGSIAPAAWGDAAGRLGRETIPSLSVNPEASLVGAMRLAGYGIVFMLCFQLANDETRARRILSVIAAAGGAYAIYGIGLEITESRYVLWYERTFEPDNLSSTFPNRNAFASYATLCLLCCFALIYRRSIRQEDISNRWRRFVVSLARYYFRRNGWLFYVAIALFTAILWTHSRAGLATAIVAFLMFAGCASHSSVCRRSALIGSFLVSAGAVLVFSMAGSATIERFGKIQAAFAERFEIYRLTIGAISDRPLLGTGLGTFSDIFPAYRSTILRPSIDFAHNTYLENALEMGIPAAIAFYAGLLGLLVIFLRALVSNRRASSYPALGIAALAAAGFHSMFDYAVQFPAVAISFAAVLGIAAAQSVDRGQPTAPETPAVDRRQ